MKTKMILDIKKLGKNLKKLRTDSDFSQRELAEKMGQLYGLTWNKAMISKWESGKTVMNLENLVAYSKYFDVKIDKLLYKNIIWKEWYNLEKENKKIVEMSFYLIFREIWEKVKEDLLLLPEDRKLSLPDFLWKADKGISTEKELRELIGRNTDNKITLEEFCTIQEEFTGVPFEFEFEKPDGSFDWKKYADTIIDIIFEYVYGIGDYTEDELIPSVLYSIVDYKSANINVTKLTESIRNIKK